MFGGGDLGVSGQHQLLKSRDRSLDCLVDALSIGQHGTELVAFLFELLTRLIGQGSFGEWCKHELRQLRCREGNSEFGFDEGSGT